MSRNVVNGVLDVHTNVYVYLTIRYGATFCRHRNGMVSMNSCQEQLLTLLTRIVYLIASRFVVEFPKEIHVDVNISRPGGFKAGYFSIGSIFYTMNKRYENVYNGCPHFLPFCSDVKPI